MEWWELGLILAGGVLAGTVAGVLVLLIGMAVL